MTEFRYDTQLLIEGHDLAEDAAEEPKPTEPTKPVDPTNPATGDGMNVALCLGAAIGMAGMAITRKKF